jgi:hypothetical protein
MLASRGVFTVHGDDRFGPTPMANALRADAPTSVRGIVLFFGHPYHWERWGHLPYSVHTGRPSVDPLRGKPVFELLDDEPEFAAVFNEGMTSASNTEIEPVLAAYDLSGFGTIVDVGGGHGRLLAAILRKATRARGILFDAEPVVAGAPAVLDAAGVADRTAVVGGSFFESVPSGGDAYLLKHIVHDWDEIKVPEISQNIRNAMAVGAKLLVIETVIPDDDREHLAKLLDLEMLVAGTGKERTAAEYTQLLNRVGFRKTRVIPPLGPVSVAESEAA